MIGQMLGPYRVLEKLGEGGMGEVWRARDTRLERDVALKVLPAEALADETARARLVREARLASKLNHPHICTIYDVGEAADQTYIAMELVEGQSLSDRVAHGALPVEEVLRYGQQLAGALAHAHAKGVVHRDFKSANVVVTPEGQVKVLDFGLAKRLAGDEIADAATASRPSLTEMGVLAGTLAYMAPEQLRGRPADARSDIWALGIVLYELATGKRPFEGKTGFELSSAILSQPVPAVPPSVPAPLAGVIDRCLAKEPGDRYQRGGEVQAALEAAASGQAVPASPAWRVALRRHRALAGTVAGAFALVVMAAILVGLDVGGVRARITGGAAAPARAIRLAVLPFANLSGDAEQEYLSDGLTQELIAQLGRLHPGTLSVIARTSVMQYKKTNTPINQIGRELGVDYVLEGSAQREAGRIRITAELIKVADQTQLWAERYERDMAGILALQSDVAQKVAGALALRLLPAEQARLATPRRVNPEAYEAYLKGLRHVYSLTPGDADTASKYFDLALQKDPDYALAHVGVALVWTVRQVLGVTPPQEAGPKAKAAALKALELDDTLAEAYYALAYIKEFTDWDWPGTEAAFRRAIALNPNLADAVVGYASYLGWMKRPAEARAEFRRAVELDPVNPLFKAVYAMDRVFARQYDEAIAEARAVLRTTPNHPVALNALWFAFSLRGPENEAFLAAKAYVNAGYDDRTVEAALDRGYARGGYREAMRSAARALTVRFRTTYGTPMDVAYLYVVAGDHAEALDWLERAFDVRDPQLLGIGTPFFDSLRSEPRYQSLLRRIGLPQ